MTSSEPQIPNKEQLPILYRDENLIAVNKPSGLLVHRSPIDKRETEFALQRVRDQIGQYVYPLHRLDRPTSGVLLFALNPETAAHLSQQFREDRVSKRYLALVRGYTPESGNIDHPIKDKADPRVDRHRSREIVAKPAQTHFSRLATVELPVQIDRYPTSRFSLVEAIPTTGRRHQIRRHLKHIAHPIIGDAKYGKGNINRYFYREYAISRLLLACTEMQFNLSNGKSLTVRAPLADDFAGLLDKLGCSH